MIAAFNPGDTVLDMVLEDDLRRTVQRRAHRRKLHQHLGTVAPVLHHVLDGFQMSDGTGQSVDHRFGLLVIVVVDVVPLVAVGVRMAVLMLRQQLVGVDMAVAMVVIIANNKICTGHEAAECMGCLAGRIARTGFAVVTDRGDYKPKTTTNQNTEGEASWQSMTQNP